MIPLSRWPAISMTLGVLAVAIVAAFAFCRATPTPLPPKEQTTHDSLMITAPAFQARVDTLKQIDSTATRRANALSRQAAHANQTADSLRRVAIAAEARAQAATSSDSAAVAWHHTADDYKAEANQRIASYDSLHTAYVVDSVGHVAARNRADAFEARTIALTDYSARLERDLARTDPPCRIAYVLKCPSRTIVVLAVVPLTLLGKVEYDRLKKQRQKTP